MAGEGPVIASRRGARAAVRDGVAGGRRLLRVPDLPPARRRPSSAASARPRPPRPRPPRPSSRSASTRCSRRTSTSGRRTDRRARRARLLGRPGEGRRLRAPPSCDAYADAARDGRPKHFPGLGAAAQPPEDGPTPSACRAGAARARPGPVPGGVRRRRPRGGDRARLLHDRRLRHARRRCRRRSRPTSCASSSEFGGVAITDDLASPAITAISTIPDAAVEALKARRRHGLDLRPARRPGGGV